MARPVEIDRNQALHTASELFWRRGYNSTSLQQLLDAMNIGKSSFYAAFESKEALFVSVLSQYQEETQAVFSQVRSQNSGLAAIRAFLNETFVTVSDQLRWQGCLAVNSTLELADVDQTLHDLASDVLNAVETELASLLFEAKTQGEICTDQSPKELAHLLMLMIQGLRVSSRRGMTRRQAKAAVSSLLQLVTESNLPLRKP